MALADLDEYRKKSQARAGEEQEQSDTTDTGDQGPPIDFIRQCFEANEVGDSLLYNYLNRNKFVHNVITNDGRGWMQYLGPHWDLDFHKQSKAAVEKVAECYVRLLELNKTALLELDEEEKTRRKQLYEEQKAIISRLDRLRSDRGRNAILSCAISNADPLTVHPDQLDQHPLLFPCQNGIVDLATGDFIKGNDPSLYLTMASPTRWEGIDAPCPTWKQALLEILDGNQDVIDYLQKVLGYGITGLRSERLFVVFYGPHGHNGKDTIMGAVQHVLGPLAGPIQTELLMSQRHVRQSSGPSPDLLALKGIRIAYAAETEKGHSFACGQIKRFSGGNQVIARGLNDKLQTYFWPTHLLFLICNDLPTAPAKDSAFWERIRVFLFPWSFVSSPREKHQRPVDKTLEARLQQEAPGILAWLVRGYLKYQQDGHLIAPQKVLDDSRNYRSHEDDIQQFLDECCTVNFEDSTRDNATNATELYQKYKAWWESGHTSMRGALSVKDFSDELQLKGFTKFKSGKNFYQFVRIKLDMPASKEDK